jgi:DNA-binding transcriptional LysR family regulator
MFERLFAKRGLSLDRLRVLLEVREAGSIVKAAGSDPVRQSQYSRQIKELEEYFGAALTERNGRTISLTPPGEELANLIKEHFIALGNFSRRLSDERVPVFIGAGESLINWLLLPVTHALQKDIPGITLRFLNLRSSDISVNLANRDLDLGLLHSEKANAQMTRKSLGRVGYPLFIPKSLVWDRKEKHSPQLLSKLPMAIMSGDVSIGRTMHQLAEKAGIRINVCLECDSFTALAHAVEGGAYAAILPEYAQPHLHRDFIRIDLPLFKPIARELVLVGQRRKAGRSPELERVHTWLAKNLRL